MKYLIEGRLSIHGPRIPRTELQATSLDDAATQAAARLFEGSQGADAAACNTSRAAGIFYPRYDYKDERSGQLGAQHSGAMLIISRAGAHVG